MRNRMFSVISCFAIITSFLYTSPAYSAKNKDTITSLTSDATTVVIGTSVQLTATVADVKRGVSPTGTVDFTVAGVQIGSPCTLASGTCSISYTWNARGTYDVVATYIPDAGFNASASTARTITVTRRPSSTVVVSSKINAYIGDPLVFTTTVSGSGNTPTGDITLYAYDNDTVIGTCTLSGGSCAINLVATNVGTHRVWAAYSGDLIEYLPSNSPYIYQVNSAKPVPTVEVTTSPTPSNFGDQVTITATVTGSGDTPTGGVNFENGESTLSSCTLSSGTCSITTSSLSVGAHTITAEYLGDAKYDVATGVKSHTVNAVVASTTTSISASQNPLIVGSSVTFTVNVSSGAGTPTGVVSILKDDLEIGTCTLTSGSCTYSTSSIPIGTFTIKAAYPGENGNYAASNGTLSLQVINQSAKSTSTLLTSSLDSVTVGSSVTLTATVTSSTTVTGTVNFYDGETSIGSCTLSSGACAISTTFSTVTTHSIRADFVANENFDGSSSSKGIVVSKRPGGVSISANKNPVPRLEPVVFTITLDPTATGTISIEDNESPKGGCTITTPGTCTVSLSFAALGGHSVDFEYSGDATHLTDVAEYQLTVGLTVPTVTVTSDHMPAEYAQTINFTATLSNTSATGTVEFFADGQGMRSCTLASGTCTAFYYRLSVGSHTVTAVYSGDANNAGATSSAITQIVNPAPTTTTITASDNPFAYGADLTLFATVSNFGTGPTGNVQFEDATKDPETILGSCTLVGSVCSLILTSPLEIGQHKLVAEYISDGNYIGSKSTALLETISPPVAAVALVSSKSKSLAGETITVTVNVTNGSSTPTGTVQLKDGDSNLGSSLTLANGSASLAISNLSVGSHSLTAVYSGDADHAAFTSAPITQIVVNPVAITFTAHPLTLAYSDPLTLTASVTSDGGVPTGTIVFEEGSNGADYVLTSCTLASGACSKSISSFSVGTHHLYAEYAGAVGYSDAFSKYLDVVVTPRPIESNPGTIDDNQPTPPSNNPQQVPVNPTPPAPVVKKELKLVPGEPIAIPISSDSSGSVKFTNIDSTGRFTRVEVNVPAGAIAGAGTLVITNAAQESSTSRGFTAFNMEILSTSNSPIKVLVKPLTIRISRQATTGLPATSEDNINWEAISAVTGGEMKAGDSKNYYVGADKSLNILVLRLSYFDILKQQNRLFVKTTTNEIWVGRVISVSARGGSGSGSITYATTTPNACSVSSDGKVTGLKAGTCLVQVKKSGDDNYLPSVSSLKAITIRP